MTMRHKGAHPMDATLRQYIVKVVGLRCGMSIYTKIDPIEKAKWIAALCSGEYAQAKRTLYDFHKPSFCCMGVKLRLAGFEPNTHPDSNGYSNCMLLPLNTTWTDHIGLNQDTRDVLVRMNDTGKTFHEIADWIDANL